MPLLAPALCLCWVASASQDAAAPAPAKQDAAASSPANARPDLGGSAEEPEGGAGVSPVEIIPRLELRQSFTKLSGDVSVHDTTLEIDIEFLRSLLLRYQVPARLMETPAGQVSGIGDLQLTLLAILASNARLVVAAIAGTELDTATHAPLGDGKQELIFGAGAALKPYRWWLAYAVVQERFSVGGDPARPEINQLATDFGSILFGRQFNWLKLDVTTTVDFPGGPAARVYGQGEAGALVIDRVGLFLRSGTQLLGPRLVDYTVIAGVRYLFRLGVARPP